MKALLTSFTEHSKMKDEQLPSSALSEENKKAKASKRASFLGMMIGFTGMKKNNTSVKENSSPQFENILAGAVNIKGKAAADKKEGDIHLANASLEIAAQKVADTNKEAEKIGSQKNQISTSEKINKPAAQDNKSASTKINGPSEGKIVIPAKENKLTLAKVAGDGTNNEKSNASIISKGTEIKKEVLLKKKTGTKSENIVHKIKTTEPTVGKKKKKIGASSLLPESQPKGKGGGVQDGSKLFASKNGKKAAKVSTFKQGQSIKSFVSLSEQRNILLGSSERDGHIKSGAEDQANSAVVKQGQSAKTLLPLSEQGKKVLFENIERGQQTKSIFKGQTNSTFSDRGKKQIASTLFSKASLKLDGKMEEQLKKQVLKQPNHKEDSRALLPKRRSLEYPGGFSSKPASSTLKKLSGQSVSVQTSAESQNNQIVNLQNFKELDRDITIKEVENKNLKTIQLSNTGGRSKFSKFLAHVARQQLSGRAPTSRQTTEWKHHRFILKDGNTVNIAAKTSSGALQLQLSAGNGELSKILQRHLPDIQQHVQQELEIEIDLQLQDFDGQQTDQQHDSVSGKDTPGDTDVGEQNSTGNLTEQAEDRRIRYFGFNKNEWVA